MQLVYNRYWTLSTFLIATRADQSDGELPMFTSERQISLQAERAHQKKADSDDADRERGEHRVTQIVVAK